MARTPEQRLLDKVVKGEHWIWTASTNNDGYGNFWFDGGVTTAHRASYILFVGPVMPDQEVDHTCRVRLCVNPAHLEAVSKSENHARVYRAYWESYVRPALCKRGHMLTDANVYMEKGKWITCRECTRYVARLNRLRKEIAKWRLT